MPYTHSPHTEIRDYAHALEQKAHLASRHPTVLQTMLNRLREMKAARKPIALRAIDSSDGHTELLVWPSGFDGFDYTDDSEPTVEILIDVLTEQLPAMDIVGDLVISINSHRCGSLPRYLFEKTQVEEDLGRFGLNGRAGG